MGGVFNSVAKRPFIGVTGSTKRLAFSWWSSKLAIWLAGGRAVRINVQHPEATVPLDGLVIGGGDDIHPSEYKEEPVHGDYDQERDALELRYIRFALDKGAPLLGICRGMQLINIVKGGNLHSNINLMRRRTSKRQIVLPRKTVFITPDSCLEKATHRQKTKVNSLHQQAVRSVGQDLRVTAEDLDGFVQAIESTDESAILGVQWHPEYLLYVPSQLRLFRWLIKQSQSGNA